MNAASANYATGHSPLVTAKTAGWFYMLNFAFAPVLITLNKLVRVNDAAATATNILAHPTLFRMGFAGNLIATASYLVVTALFYQIFKPVNKTLSLVAAVMSSAGCAILAVGCVIYLQPLVILTGAHATGPALEQAQTLALEFVKLYGQCFNTSFVFFGFYCLLIGNLVYRSTFLPRILGVGMIMAGLAWLTFLWPPLARSLLPYLLLFGTGEMVLATWLLVKGVNVDRWNEQAGMT